MPKGFTATERRLGEEIVRRTEEVDEATRQRDESPYGYLLDQDVEEILDRYDAEHVGSGCECVVTNRKGNPAEVVAFTYKNLEPNEAKKAFYLQRICSTLFPHNFPHFAAGIGTTRKEATATGTVRQHIRGNKLTLVRRSEIRYPFDDVPCVIGSLRIPIWVDTTAGNFTLGTDGGEYYLDTAKLTNDEPPWNIPVIRKFMDEARTDEGKPTYTARDKRIVEKSIRRLAELGLAEITE